MRWKLLLLSMFLLSVAALAVAQTSRWGSGGQTLTCQSSVVISTAASGSTQLVALTSAQSIYVCGFVLNVAGTTNVKFVAGTGTNCATSPTDLSGAMAFVANNTVAFGAGVGPVLVVPVGKALCVNNSAAIQLSGLLTYAIF